MDSCSLFEQNAQDPLANFDEVFPELARLQREPKKKKTKRGGQEESPVPAKKSCQQSGGSFVYSNEVRRGVRLIRVEVVDLDNNSAVPCDSDNDKILYSSQYVVTDNFDPIMEQTETLIRNISKKICDSNF